LSNLVFGAFNKPTKESSIDGRSAMKLATGASMKTNFVLFNFFLIVTTYAYADEQRPCSPSRASFVCTGTLSDGTTVYLNDSVSFNCKGDYGPSVTNREPFTAKIDDTVATVVASMRGQSNGDFSYVSLELGDKKVEVTVIRNASAGATTFKKGSAERKQDKELECFGD
jgi:hypothetical protein